MRKVLVFTTVVELCTGLALMAVPDIVFRLILGAELAGAGVVAARWFGVALLALALACWPNRRTADSSRAGFRAMLVYNVLLALYLVELGTAARMKGMLLWPAAILHVLVAFALVWTARRPSSA